MRTWGNCRSLRASSSRKHCLIASSLRRGYAPRTARGRNGARASTCTYLVQLQLPTSRRRWLSSSFTALRSAEEEKEEDQWEEEEGRSRKRRRRKRRRRGRRRTSPRVGSGPSVDRCRHSDVLANKTERGVPTRQRTRGLVPRQSTACSYRPYRHGLQEQCTDLCISNISSRPDG